MIKKNKISVYIILFSCIFILNSNISFAENQKTEINIENIDEETLKEILKKEEIQKLIKEINEENKIEENEENKINSNIQDESNEKITEQDLLNILQNPSKLKEAIDKIKDQEILNIEKSHEKYSIKDSFINFKNTFIKEINNLIKTIWNTSKNNLIILSLLIVILKIIQIKKHK